MKLAELNQESAREMLKTAPIAILPIGATEVHGNHLPLGTDMFLAQGLAEKLEQTLGS